jgi:hypothetical protein
MPSTRRTCWPPSLGPAPVDYLLANIESAWYEMLRHGRWTENVRCIKIEIAEHYDEAVPLLEASAIKPSCAG